MRSLDTRILVLGMVMAFVMASTSLFSELTHDPRSVDDYAMSEPFSLKYVSVHMTSSD